MAAGEACGAPREERVRPASRPLTEPSAPAVTQTLQQQRQRKTQLEGFHTAYLSLHSEEY